MRYIQNLLLGLVLFITWLPAQAIITGELMMVRSDKNFPQAMGLLKDAIKKQGYTVSSIQRVDSGLVESGYKSDKYRIVFFGKTSQIHELTNKYPELIPYLPLKIVIYAEAGETLLVTTDPNVFTDFYPYPQLRNVFKLWHDDLIVILKAVQN